MTLGDLASLATAVGLLLTGLQLWLNGRLAKTQFEDGLSTQYRDLLASIPVAALLGQEVPLDRPETLGAFYRYVDLCNEQVFLRTKRRVRSATWRNWAEGMQRNLSRPAFRSAWEKIKTATPDGFTELRRLDKEGFRSDPVAW